MFHDTDRNVRLFAPVVAIKCVMFKAFIVVFVIATNTTANIAIIIGITIDIIVALGICVRLLPGQHNM